MVVPWPEVMAKVTTDTSAAAATVTVPRPAVIAPTLVRVTGKAVPQAPSPQVPLPQPLIIAIS